MKNQGDILQPKGTLVEVLNGLFQRKKIYINERNEIEAATDSGKKLSIRGLSSGEKQLIIILGEALLQRESPWIYIADEPELSLHVKWQEKLIENLRRINPQAQIVCATHSPDVVTAPDGWAILPRDGGLSAHWEHTLVVTKDGYEILTPHNI